MKTARPFKRKLLDTLTFFLFLIGSYILIWKFGRWAAIGVALEIISVYFMIMLKIKEKEDEIIINDDEDKEADNSKRR